MPWRMFSKRSDLIRRPLSQNLVDILLEGHDFGRRPLKISKRGVWIRLVIRGL